MRHVEFHPVPSRVHGENCFVDVAFPGDAISFAKLGIATIVRKPDGSNIDDGTVPLREPESPPKGYEPPQRFVNLLDVPGFHLWIIGESTYKLYCPPNGVEKHDRYIGRDGKSTAHYVLRELLREFGEAGLDWSKVSATGNPWPCRHNPNGPPLSLESYGLPANHNSLAYCNNR